MLLSMYAYFGYTLQKRATTYFVALAFFAAGLLSKPSIVTLPFVLLLFDFWPYQRIALGGNSSFGTMTISNMRFFGRLVIEKVPFFALSTLYLGIFTFSLGRLQSGVSTESVSLALRLANALVSYVHYGWNVLWPSNLAVYYPFPQSIPAWQAVSSGLLILVITIFVLIVFRRRPFFAVGWFWFLGTLVPVIGIAQVGLWPARADRWVYMPMVGILIMLVWGCGLALDKIRLNERFVAVVMAVVIIIYADAAHLQTSHWRDSVTLFKRTVAVTQNNFVAHDNLGLALVMIGRFDEAFKHFSQALRIAPSFWKAHQNLGALYLIKGDYERAIFHLKKALQGQPNSVRIYNNLGRVYARQGLKKEATASFRKALDLDPGNPKAIENLNRLMSNG
jgi:tetratricopeptide (TPR) repeat protein